MIKILRVLLPISIAAVVAQPALAQTTSTSSTAATHEEEEGDPGAPRFHSTPNRREPDPTPAKIEEASVVVAKGGDLALFFRFGGLGSLFASGSSRNIDGLVVTQAGMKFVLSEQWMVPLTFGAGLRSVDGGADADVSAGLDIGAGIEYHFRQWRRISPFFGVNLSVGFSKPVNDDVLVGVGLGPTIGVEYYIADRVSLSAQYLMVVQIQGADEDLNIEVTTLAGGAMNLTVYF